MIVKDANGRPVPGVAVTFAVDSGGGAVDGPTATTAADGVAAVGGWRLGPAKGRQILSGNAAGLPPVRFVATAAIASRTISDTSFASGTIEIKQSGPLSGTKLEIPAGAFSGATTWKLEQRSTADWPRRPGINPIGAALQITRSASGIVGKPLLLTLPAPLVEGHRAIVLLRNPASGAIVAAPSYSGDPGTVTAMLLHLDGSYLTAGPAAAAAAFQARSGRL